MLSMPITGKKRYTHLVIATTNIDIPITNATPAIIDIHLKDRRFKIYKDEERGKHNFC